MITLYGPTNRLSSNTLKIRVALGEAGVDHQYVPIDLQKGEHKKPEFLAVNPHGKVPAMIDDGFHLAESNAILWYVAEKHPQAKLLPADVPGRAKALAWCDFASFYFYPTSFDLFVQGNRPANEQNHEIIDRARANLERALAVLETSLAGRDHLAGVFSIGDLACAANLRTVIERQPQYRELPPATAAWYQRVTARPAWRAAVG